MNIFKAAPVNTVKPVTTECDYDRKWLMHSADRWRYYFGLFTCDIDVNDQGEERTADLLRRAAIAADQALQQEQERWGRAVLDEGAK